MGSFLNARLPFKLVEETVHTLWDKYGLQKVFLQDKGFLYSNLVAQKSVITFLLWARGLSPISYFISSDGRKAWTSILSHVQRLQSR